MRDLEIFLQPFETHTKKLQRREYPTLPYVTVAYDKLLENCYEHEGDSTLLAALRREGYRGLQEHVIITDEHKIATFLWPRMKILKMYPLQWERQEVIFCHILFVQTIFSCLPQLCVEPYFRTNQSGSQFDIDSTSIR